MKIISLTLACLLIASGCAGAEPKPGPGTYATAQDVVGKLFDSYRYYSRETFRRTLVPVTAAQPGFIDQIETSYFSGTLIELNFFIDSALREADTLAVKIKWEKRNQPYSGNTPVMVKGSAELTFKESNGDWLLYQISGDNPF
jgi:hypothetical protein